MPWLALEFEVAAAHAESIADALLELGALSVATEDAAAGSPLEAALFAEPTPAATVWPRNRLTALLPLDAAANQWIAAAARAVGLAAVPSVSAARIEDDDWVRCVQQQFAPIQVGARLWIVPSWCEPPSHTGAIVIRLDPGLAFGTGSHPSTRLVLAWLERSLGGGERVLDYGCGSGILALAAAKLGAAQVSAVDLDCQALAACNANARTNGIALQVAEPAALEGGDFDVIVANILAGPLIGLASEFAARTRRGARIALSGILDAQAGEVRAAFAHAFATAVAASEEGWSLVAGVRR